MPVTSSNHSFQSEVDPRFGLQPRYTTTRLPATAILMNTMNYLAQAADVPYDAHIEVHRHATFPDYPTVGIDVQVMRSRDQFQNFMLVWAMYEATWDMVAKNSFYVSQFGITWKGKVIAILRYSRTPDRQTLDHGANSTAAYSNPEVSTISITQPRMKSNIGSNGTQATINIPKSPATSSPNATTNDHLSLSLKFLDNGSPVPIYAVFMAVFAALKDNAYFPLHGRVTPFASTTPGFDSQVAVVRGGSPMEQEQPPFFERHHVTVAVSNIPGFMLAERRFAELSFTVLWGKKE